MTYTKGNVIVEDIKKGDIHYEYELGICVKSKVLNAPVKGDDGNWEWISEQIPGGKKIEYVVNPEYPQYSVNLYDYEAYKTMT